MAWIHVAGAALGLAAAVPSGRAYTCTFVSAGLATRTAAVQHLGEDPVPSNDTAAFSFDVQP